MRPRPPTSTLFPYTTLFRSSQGRLDVVPMGYLICGPVGTGKSFIVQCFAKEIGIPVVELLNFRSKWQGQTEANLERVLALLDAIGPVAVVVDEEIGRAHV